MDKKKIVECLEEMAEKIMYMKDMVEGKKEIESLDDLREKAEKYEEKEEQ